MRTGNNSQQRAIFLKTIYAFAQSVSRAKWQPKFEYDVGF